MNDSMRPWKWMTSPVDIHLSDWLDDNMNVKLKFNLSNIHIIKLTHFLNCGDSFYFKIKQITHKITTTNNVYAMLVSQSKEQSWNVLKKKIFLEENRAMFVWKSNQVLFVTIMVLSIRKGTKVLWNVGL